MNDNPLLGGKQLGGWYNNPAAGGANQRYWGEKYGWTTGSDPTQGGSSPSSSSSTQTNAPASSTSSTPSVDWQGMFNTLNNKISSNQAATDANFAQGKQDIANFNTQFASDVPAITSAAEEKYNLPQQYGMVSALNNRINDLNTRGSQSGFASGTQTDAALQTHYIPQLNTATTNLNTGEGLAQNEIANNLKPDQTAATLLSDRLSREATGYTAEHQQTLDTLLGMMNSGVALTTTQANQALALATLEQNKVLKEEELNNSLQVANIGNQKPFSVSPGGYVYNPASGTSNSVGNSVFGDSGISTPPPDYFTPTG